MFFFQTKGRHRRWDPVSWARKCEKETDEAPYILRAAKGYKIALCIEGEKCGSKDLASRIKSLCDKGEEITFIIGSSEGLSAEVKKQADLRLSFSDLTFPHQLMRVILCEQVYRAFMIISGGAYHK